MRTLLLVTLCLAAAVSTARAATQNGPGHGGGYGPGRGGGATPCHAPPPTAREDDGKVYDAREVTCRAVITFKPEPVYPPRARKDGVQGVVRLRTVLLASGKVGKLTVFGRGMPEGLNEAAIKAARRIKFTPAIKDDRWVSQRVLVEYDFNLY